MTMRNSSFSSAAMASSADSTSLNVVAFALKNGLEGKAHVLFVVNDQDREGGEAHLVNFIRIRRGNSRVKRVPLPGSDSTVTGAAVHFGVMFDDGQAQAGALGAGGEIGLEDLVHFVGRDAGAVVGDGDDDRIVLAVAGGDFDFAAAVHGFAGVLEQVDQHAGQVLPLHEDRRQIGA